MAAVKGEEIVATIDKETGEVRLTVISERPGHSEALLPFELSLSNGDKSVVKKHVHDHAHGGHIHQHGGGHGHSH